MLNILRKTGLLWAGILFLACSGSPAPIAAVPPSADELDSAIRETSNYLNQQLPKGNKLAILNIQSEFPALSEYIIDELIANTVNDRVFSVADRQQLNTIRAELDFQMSGEVDDDTAQALGRMAGAQIIISGAVSKIGDMYRLRVRALSVQTASIEGQFNRNIPDSATVSALVRSQATGYGGQSNWEGRPSASVTAPAVTPDPEPVQNAFPVTGLWKVTGRDSKNWAADLVIEEIDGERFSGHFDWYYSPGTEFVGREHFRGTFNSRTKAVQMNGYRVTDPSRLGLGTYEAYLSSNSLDFEKGTWRGGVWQAKWER